MDSPQDQEKRRRSQYDSERRFISYWHQFDEVLSVAHGKVLEVGVGDGMLAHCLRAEGVDVTTADVDERLKPDVVADINDLPFEHCSFEVVACFEVLEHLPWESVVRALSELHRVTTSYAVVSLPDVYVKYRMFFQFYRGTNAIRKVLVLPRARRRRQPRFSDHLWEIGLAGYPLSRIESEFERAGFIIERNFLPFGNAYHRFFRLRKIEPA